MRPLIVLAPLAFALAACGPDGNPTVEGGGCKLIEQPNEPICALTTEQQRWLDINLSRYGVACHWEVRQGEACKTPVLPSEVNKLPPKKRTLKDRFLGRNKQPAQ